MEPVVRSAGFRLLNWYWIDILWHFWSTKVLAIWPWHRMSRKVCCDWPVAWARVSPSAMVAMKLPCTMLRINIILAAFPASPENSPTVLYPHDSRSTECKHILYILRERSFLLARKWLCTPAGLPQSTNEYRQNVVICRGTPGRRGGALVGITKHACYSIVKLE